MVDYESKFWQAFYSVAVLETGTFSRDLLEIFIEFASASKTALEMIALKKKIKNGLKKQRTILLLTVLYIPRIFHSFWEESIPKQQWMAS